MRFEIIQIVFNTFDALFLIFQNTILYNVSSNLLKTLLINKIFIHTRIAEVTPLNNNIKVRRGPITPTHKTTVIFQLFDISSQKVYWTYLKVSFFMIQQFLFVKLEFNMM